MTMRKSFLLALVLLALTTISGIFATAPPAGALSGSEFKADRIIDDSVFFRSGDLSPAQIQSFLNSKVPVCDTNHAKTSSVNDSGPPYTCLKDYRQNTVAKPYESELCNALAAKSSQSAAQMIYDVSQACGVSTRVLLVLLQKEQSLVTDTWPWDIQYRSATGYGCPDTAACDSQYYGFFNQIYNAARQYKYYAKTNGPNYRVGYTNYIQYNPNAACGGSNVTIQSQATAGLYNYTPYRPNSAALNNLYGSGDGCSSYGNRNFWRLYREWFGSTTNNIAYDAIIESNQVYTDSARTQPFTSNTINLQPSSKAYVTIKALNTGQYNWDKSFVRLGIHSNTPSVFADTSWFNASRPAQLTEDVVTPGQVGTFNFSITAPNSLASYTENYQLVAEGKAWINGNLRYLINVTNPAPAKNTVSSLGPGSSIKPGQNLISPDGLNTLTLQKDGNLVLYSEFSASWSTKTAGRSASQLIMQGDGNLVLYDSNGKPMWNAQTNGNPGARFVMQTDGNLVIYSTGGAALWSLGTIERPSLLSYAAPFLYDNNVLHIGQQLETADRKYRLILQTDGNLVLYSTNRALWSSRTQGKKSYVLVMQHDGNLVLYNTDSKALWYSGTSKSGYSKLATQQDGNLVVYDRFGRPTWNTQTNGQ